MKNYYVVIETQVSDFGLLPLIKAREKGYTTVFCTNRLERYSKIPSYNVVIDNVDHVLEFDTNDVDKIINELRRNSISPISGVITICDYSLEIVAQVAAALNLPSLTHIAASNCRDKLNMREACRKNGVSVPEYLHAETLEVALQFAKKIDFPVVVKPMTDSASVGVILCWSQDDVEQAFRALNKTSSNVRGQAKRYGVLIEEYMIGPEVSVESIFVKGERFFYGVTDKSLGKHPYFVEIGDTFPSELPQMLQNNCIETSRAALNAVKHDFGVSHVELKITKKGVMVVEINGRVPGNEITKLVELSTGIDLLDCQVELSLGRHPKFEPTQQNAAASVYFTSLTSGVVQQITGLELASRVDGIVKIQVDVDTGDYVQAASSNHDILGTVVTHAPTSAMARRLADTAAIQVEFNIQPLKEVVGLE
ncbi:ATP-grasp domain-containing protein [Pseudomonas sp. RL_5y_Pfl2_73]|uniref:ATP-grasp domain-containing protein n=1 Tax=Pseudomonas sp. RL_5y_Pfl2_73 TaxID=3088713 RepID=UPI0030DCDCF2